MPLVWHEQGLSMNTGCTCTRSCWGGGKPYFQSGLSLTLKPLGTESLPQDVTLMRYAPAS
ncbi:hypothetical protein ACVILI_004316 [Mesorhizobium sp. USDA 4775]